MASTMKKRLLLVEDEVFLALSEKTSLEKYGYEVTTVNTGEKAVQTVEADPQSIDLVLMDIDLGKGIDGTEAAEVILKNYDLPMVFLSSHTEPAIVERTEGITSYGYVVKSSSITVLDASIKMAFRLYNAHRELKMQNENLRITLNSIGDAVIAADGEGRVIRMNPVAEGLCGWKAEEARGKALTEVFHIVQAETRQEAENPLQKVLETGTIVGPANHTMLISRDGREYQIADSAAPIRNIDNRIEGVVIVFRDVTGQYEKDRQLTERVKELNGLYKISEIIEESGITLEGILQKTASVIPASYSYPEDTSCRIILDGQEYLSAGFRRGKHMQSSSLRVNGTDAGTIEVWYAEDKPFLKEEQQLLDAIAERLGRVIERIQNEEKLRESEARWKFALDNAGDGLWDWNAETNRVYFSPKWKEILGYEEQEVSNGLDEWESRIHPEDKERCYKDLEDHFKGITPMYTNIHRVRCKNGEYKWILDRGKVIEWTEDGKPLRVLGTHFDITELQHAKDEIQRQLEEKEILLKEVHHRIKNNIASIGSLLSIQADSDANAQTKSALQDAASRIQSMQVLYEKLLLAEDYREVSVKDYVEELLHSLLNVFTESKKIKIDTSITDFALPSKKIISLGSIINELMTNIFKYAFPDEAGGKASLSIGKAGNHVTLVIQDYGVGLPEDGTVGGFGLTLVNMFSEQLNGSFSIENRDGTRCVVEFDTVY